LTDEQSHDGSRRRRGSICRGMKPRILMCRSILLMLMFRRDSTDSSWHEGDRMGIRKRLQAIVYCVLLLCVIPGCNQAPLEDVKIVVVGHSHEIGAQDYYTVVEFPDGTRRRRDYQYGEVGDAFRARRLWSWSWE
jgi:hypothetical protein